MCRSPTGWLPDCVFHRRVRLSRLDCLEQVLLVKKLGKISTGDAAQIKRIWTQQIQLHF